MTNFFTAHWRPPIAGAKKRRIGVPLNGRLPSEYS
jgi:hypothetical protein